jgi:hypothetical protein
MHSTHDSLTFLANDSYNSRSEFLPAIPCPSDKTAFFRRHFLLRLQHLPVVFTAEIFTPENKISIKLQGEDVLSLHMQSGVSDIPVQADYLTNDQDTTQ